MRLNIFIFFLAIFAVTTAGHIYTIDSYLNYAVTKSLGSDGSLAIPRFMMTVEGEEGRHYSKLGIGQSVVNLPLYWVGDLVERISPGNPAFRAYSRGFTIPHTSGPLTGEPQSLIRTSDSGGAKVFFTTLTNAFVTAALCLIFWVLLKDFGLSSSGALWGAALMAFSTPVWLYSRDLFSEPLFTVSLVGTFYLLGGPGSRRVLLAGMFSCLGILARMSYLPLVGIFAVYIVLTSEEKAGGMKRAAMYCIYCLPAVLVMALLNLARFGGVMLTGYHTAFDKGFSVPLLRGLTWNLTSPYRSIFLYAPAVILFFLGIGWFARRYRARMWLIVAIIVYVFVVYSKWWAWHGGWCWGPRFLVPVIPLLLLPGLAAIRKHRRWLLPIAIVGGVAGFVVQIGAILVNYTAAYDYWIKIGKLDWAEVDIHMFSPIATHLRAVLATSPRDYDLWIVQAWGVNRLAGLWTVAFVALLGYALVRIHRSLGPVEDIPHRSE
jgi:hypothetical protein